MTSPASLNMSELMEFWRFILIDLSLQLNGSLTSGPRTRERNKQVGGHPRSRHLWDYGRGCAADLVFLDNETRKLAQDRVTNQGYHWFVGPDYVVGQLHVQAEWVGQ